MIKGLVTAALSGFLFGAAFAVAKHFVAWIFDNHDQGPYCFS